MLFIYYNIFNMRYTFSSMYNFLEIPQLQEQHNLYSARFEKYGRTIEMELVLCKNKSKTYASLAEFIKIIKSEIDHLVDNGPYIPVHILKQDSTCVRIHEMNNDLENTDVERKDSIELQINNLEVEKSRVTKSFDNSRSRLKKELLESV